MTGCQQAVFDAQSLPPQFAARPVFDVSTLDLAKLANSTYGSEQILPGDTLELTVLTGAEEDEPTTWPLRVADNGGVEVPLVGPIQLAGYDVQSAQELVRSTSIERGIYRRPTVSLSVGQRKTNRVTVVGAVETAGAYELPVSRSDLLSAIVASGGLSAYADTTIEIQRARPAPATNLPSSSSDFAQTSYQADSFAAPNQNLTPQVVRIDLVKASQDPETVPVMLGDGDVVTVRKLPTRYVQVLGLVNDANRYEIPPGQNARLLDAIAMAGGTRVAVADKVLVIRQVPGQTEPVVIEVSLRKAKKQTNANILLANGDVVSVEETPVTFVVSTLQQVIRFGVNGSVATF